MVKEKAITTTFLGDLYANASKYYPRFAGPLAWLNEITFIDSHGDRKLKNPKSDTDNQEVRAFDRLVKRDDRWTEAMRNFERRVAENLRDRREAAKMKKETADGDARGQKRGADHLDEDRPEISKRVCSVAELVELPAENDVRT